MEPVRNKTYKRVMTIAGSDPSGGAGVQADIKTISACGCFATSAIVAVVDENTVGVTGVFPIPADFVVGQIHSILDDIGTDAVKIGMLHSSELIHAVRNVLDEYPAVRDIVLDPVMVATSGDPLLQADAAETSPPTSPRLSFCWGGKFPPRKNCPWRPGSLPRSAPRYCSKPAT